MMDNLFVYTFYRFKSINKIKEYKNIFDKYLLNKDIKGTILIANEGINGSLSGPKRSLDKFIKLMKSCLNIRKLELKINQTEFLPFNRMKVRLKKEIVSLGQGHIDVNKFRGKLIKAEEWDNVIANKNTKLIDVRNIFEIEIGKFKGSINPRTQSFRQFASSLEKLKIKKNDKIAMYCTGGIRCEKASAFMKLNGYNNVVQLHGGIIKYLEYTNKEKKESLFQGECFVFDDRVSINKKLNKGKFFQCYGCRSPISKKDLSSYMYVKGVSCPICYNKRTISQKKNSLIRQQQIDFAETRNIDHPFKKITK